MFILSRFLYNIHMVYSEYLYMWRCESFFLIYFISCHDIKYLLELSNKLFNFFFGLIRNIAYNHNY
jgi:hypothetical protein